MKKLTQVFALFVALIILTGAVIYCWPYILDHQNLIIGFTIAITLIAIASLAMYWGIKLRSSQVSSSKYLAVSIPIIISGIIILIIQSNKIVEQNKLAAQEQEAYHKSLLQQDQNKVIAEQNTSVYNEILEVISQYTDLKFGREKLELKQDLVTRLARLSHTLKPYHTEGINDSISIQLTSPERGRLLQIILTLEFDTSIRHLLFTQSNFKYADLKKADLSSKDLSYSDLEGAQLNSCQCNNAIFNDANLNDADLTEANLKGGQFERTLLKRSILNWSKLDGSNFSGANLDGCFISDASIINAKMENASMKYAKASYSLFMKSKLKSLDLFGSDLSFSNLSDSDLRQSNMRNTNLLNTNFESSEMTKAVLRGADLDKTNLRDSNLDKVLVMGGNWFNVITSKNVIGADSIIVQYTMEENDDFDSNFVLNQKQQSK